MKFTPGRIVNLAARAAIALCAVFSGVNLLFIALGTQRLMPMALSMTGYLAKTGLRLSSEHGIPFFTIYSLTLAGILCAVLLLCSFLAGRNPGWLAAGAVIFIADCIGMALLICDAGFRSGYLFEIIGHVVILAAFITALCSVPRRKKSAEQ